MMHPLQSGRGATGRDGTRTGRDLGYRRCCISARQVFTERAQNRACVHVPRVRPL